MSDEASFRVLFVDDEERVLSGLRRQLRSHRDRWALHFALSGEAALEELQAFGADVIVSDMRMPGMSGTELLSVVRDRWPDAVRIILSGQTEHGEIVKRIGCVHQFLQKPCPPLDLIRTIERCRELASLLERSELRSVASAISSLPVVPESYAELLAVLDDPASGASETAGVIERDVGLATKVLQLVNSAFFGLPRRIDSVRDAVSLLGVSQLRAVALSGATFDALDTHEACGAAIRSLWASSFEIGRLAEWLARECEASPRVIAQSRLAGMLSLVGRAVLIRMHPDHFERARCEAGRAGVPLQDMEAALLGASQQCVGGYALGMWAFEDDVVSAVTFQGSPELCEMIDVKHPVSFLHLARCCARPTELVERPAPSAFILDRLGLTEADLRAREEGAAA